MTTRLIVRGREVWRNGPWFKPAVHSAKVVTEPIAPKVAPLRSGEAWQDPEDKLNYRVVDEAVLRPEDGWATMEYWTKYLCTSWHIFRELVERGCFDAAIGAGSSIRKFRMLDKGRAFEKRDEIRVRNMRRGRAWR